VVLDWNKYPSRNQTECGLLGVSKEQVAALFQECRKRKNRRDQGKMVYRFPEEYPALAAPAGASDHATHGIPQTN
jgi:hypothetical protein